MRRGFQSMAGMLLATSVAACAHAGAPRATPVAQRHTVPPTTPVPTTPAPTVDRSPATSARVIGAAVADVTFVSALHGWALTKGALYETTDRGRHWRPVRLPASPITHVRFVNAAVGYAWGGTGRLWLTADDGRSWRPGGLRQLDSLEASATGVWAIAGTQPYADVWRSEVGSTSWTKLRSEERRVGKEGRTGWVRCLE